ncbi:hypothetical protein [Mesomycoplasma lagogenitalium]|uniref:Uncharacterized protein n=1 Tax=Mesomycoplasma lagogenitalium TaxID=171286 RepID=A0ABY8LTA2_9BACT|nr:hypothetical protein [Mesomycoplasma lagogenitalium]WGI36473.1 hypothetical protein QEG99_03340 [Mesomycoplasma lagogenitalium]
MISGLAHDGYNKFAKVFFYYEDRLVQDDRWKVFLEYAKKSNIDPEHIEKLREIFGDSLIIQVEKQNTLGFSFFTFSMIALMFIAFSFMSSLTFVTFKEFEVRLTSLYHNKMFSKEGFDTVGAIINQERSNWIKSKNGTLKIEVLQQAQQSEKQKTEEVKK